MESGKKPIALKLRDIIREIQRSKGWSQAVLAEKLGTRQPTVSKMTLSAEWEQHWQVFLRLLPICYDLGLFTRKENNSNQLEK